MRKLIYIAVVGFFFVIGFLNLERNEWYPTELPDFQIGEKIIPKEEWVKTLIGEWNYVGYYSNYVSKGTVLYNQNNTFKRKVAYESEIDGELLKSGGTIKGKWFIPENNTWVEVKEYCNIQPEKFEICSKFISDTTHFGKIQSDIWDYELLYFNDKKIEFRGKSLSTGNKIIYRLTRKSYNLESQ